MKLFAKAKVPAWKAWVPVVNTWKFLELGGYPGAISLLTFASMVFSYGYLYYFYSTMFSMGYSALLSGGYGAFGPDTMGNFFFTMILMMIGSLLSVVGTVFMCMSAYQISRKLGKDGVFVLLYIFLSPVWLGMMAFDKSVWNDSLAKPAKGKERPPAWTPVVAGQPGAMAYPYQPASAYPPSPTSVYPSPPANVNAEPTNVYGQPAGVSSGPTNVYGQPAGVTSEPTNVYAPPPQGAFSPPPPPPSQGAFSPPPPPANAYSPQAAAAYSSATGPYPQFPAGAYPSGSLQPIAAQYPVPAGAKTSRGFSVTALISGIVGLFLPGFSIVAIIFGALGMRKPGGKGLGITGLVLGLAGVIAWVIVLALIAFYA